MNDKVEKLDVETIKKLVEKAEPAETKFLLFLETNIRPGECYEDKTEFQVILGEVEKIPLEHRFNYPTENSVRWLLIPKTIPVVIKYYHEDDYEGTWRKWESIYVFTAEGWKRVHVY